jgi:pimeloyl-ACP methyl ester carboxylesterase
MRLPLQSSALFRCLLIALASVGLSTAQTKRPGTASWVRNVPSNREVIIFVHGVLGDERSTWTSGDQYWPSMLTNDPTFDGQNIYVYHYPSPRLNQSFSIDEIADNMRLVLSTDGVLRNDRLTFVSHSMGGLVMRAFILKYRYVVPKIRLLYFFATPTTGSPYAVLAGLVSRNPQFKQLYPMKSDSYLAPLQSNWLAANLGLKSYCAYETLPLYGQIIVERQSATNLCTERLDPIDGDHITIVKPGDQNSNSYRALKSALLETAPASRSAATKEPLPKPTSSPRRMESTPSSKPSVGSRDSAALSQSYPSSDQPRPVNNCPNGICISGGTVKNGNPTVNNFGPPPPPTPTVTICLSELLVSDGRHTMQLLFNTSAPVMEPWYALFFDGAVLEGSASSEPGSFGYTHSRADKLPEPETTFVFRVTSIDFGIARWLPGREIKVLIPSANEVHLKKILTGSGEQGFDEHLEYPCGGSPQN